MKGELGLMGPMYAVQKELMSMPEFGGDDDSFFAAEYRTLKNLKKAFLLTAGAAAKQQMDGKVNLEEEQELLMNISRMVMDIYVAESALLRVSKRVAIVGQGAMEIQAEMARLFLHEAADRMNIYGKNVLNALPFSGDEQRIVLMGLKRFTKTQPYNYIASRRKIAAALIEANDYTY
jgi:hypothetical protein